MKKNNKGFTTTVLATSLATLGFVSYKVLKKKYPDKLSNFNDYIKNNILNFKEDENISFCSQNVDNNINSYNISTNDLLENTQNNHNVESNDKNNIQYNIDNTIENTKIENTTTKDLNTENLNKALDEQTKQDIQKHLDNIIEDNEKELKIPDNYIEDEIKYQLCLSNKETITKDVLKKLERIDFFEIDDNDINAYCEFLSKYTNIKSIVIDSLNPIKYNGNIAEFKPVNSLKDVSPINKLESLEELSFNWGIENIDFSSLKTLPNLKKLEIKFGMLNDISFINNFENLEYLEVMLANNIKDLNSLNNLSNLKTLYVYTNINIDTESLKNIKSLEYVYINGKKIQI